jgi:hypothetical protein
MRIYVIIAHVVLLMLVSCAQIVSPTGGPKDETPPKVKGEYPPNGSVNFTARSFTVDFDEFFVIQSPNENVIISPPLRKNPTFTIKRKSLVVKWTEELAPDATYIFNFGEAIRDNNESNILNNYTYVFSTGAVLDSMELKGKLTDAVTGDPVEGAMLMLYTENLDSLPKTSLPNYFGRTGKDGQFHIRNIPDRQYKAFALKDQNSNFRFDVPDEKIGFIDTLLRPLPIERPKKTEAADSLRNDSLQTDSLDAAMDTLSVRSEAKDTVFDGKGMKKGTGIKEMLTVKMFVEEDTTQFLKKSFCEHYGKLVFIYNRPVSRFTALMPAAKTSFKKQWAIKEFSAKRDTVTLWTTDVVPDSLDLILLADGRRDTVQLVMKARDALMKTTSGGGKKGGKTKQSKFSLSMQTDPPIGRPPKPGDPLWLVWNHPVVDMDLAGIELREDSILVNYKLTSTDTALRRFAMEYPWAKGKKYSVHINDSAVVDLFGLRNDTIRFEFTGIEASQLGDISLKVSNLSGQKLLELINASKQTIAKRVVNADGIVSFPRLDPGKYALVMVDDLNANGRWDSGRYAFKLQPEPIIILKTDIDVRANWLMELEWDASGSELK